jgi:ATP-dependent RNA helicase DeaD
MPDVVLRDHARDEPGAARRKPAAARDGKGAPRRQGDPMTRIVVTAGDQRGVRPKDLVGAIANEAHIPGESIGAIEIREDHSLVEVPESVADKVIRALAKTTIKGQRVTARRETGR